MIIYFTDKYTGGREESRRLLKEALTVHTGDAERAKTLIGTLKEGEHGKPYTEGFCCFSISHTGSIWAVLFADHECGLDIQLERKCDIKAISERFFAAQDAAMITSAEDFFRIWTRREALVKALGSTVADTDLPAVSGETAEFGDRRFSIRDICIPGMSDLYAAVCLEGEAPDPVSEIHRL